MSPEPETGFPGGLDPGALCENWGTPLYVYDARVMQEQLAAFRAAFSALPHRILYAAKALSTLEVLRLFRKEGTGLDAVSVEEIELGLRAGFRPENILFTPELSLRRRPRTRSRAGSADQHRLAQYTGEICRLPRIEHSLLPATETMAAGRRKLRGCRALAGVDTGFHHLLRPRLYGAWHEITNLSNPGGKPAEYRIVGQLCEPDDLAAARSIPEIREGDLLAFHNAGAYGASMASNYNSRLRPAELLLQEGGAKLIRRRETLEDLLGTQLGA